MKRSRWAVGVLGAVALASVFCLTGCPWLGYGIKTCIDFNGLTAGTTYNVGDTITLNEVDIVVLPFQWSNLTTFTGGTLMVTNAQAAGGSGMDLNLNNVCLGFDFKGKIRKVTLKFGEYGGNTNVEAEGTLENREDLDGLTALGSLTVTVNNLGGDLRDFTIEGKMEPTAFSLDPGAGTFNFIIGGQELVIDDVCSAWF